VDKDYFGTGKRIYVWDGAKKKIRLVPGGTCNATDMVGPFSGIVGRPQGIIANNNPSSTRRHNLTVTVTPAPEIREYNMLGTPTLIKTWTSANLPIAGPAQMAITPEPAERLVIADRTNNTVVLLNQATDKSRALDWALTSPRAIAVDPLPSGAVNAIVGEATMLKRFPLTFNAVSIQIYVESGSGVTTADAQAWFDRAKAYLLKCRVNLVLRAITSFTDPALRDLTWAAGGTSRAPCGTYPFSTEETTLLSMRSAVTTDLNVYVIRNFIRDDTLAVDTRYGGYGITQDCYSNVTDSSQSGLLLAGGQLKGAAYRGAGGIVLAHEIGHALLYRGTWPGGNEHNDPATGLDWAADTGNLMRRFSDAKRDRFTVGQCTNLTQDYSFIIFRSDP